ncbi:nitrogenase component 1 [Beduini massiliensis]|uniref:nitrogenase component 1 n=1 Tax=Beduini massiliensis TaxID=1585974 RepID=UPI00059A8C64|nr:nitrogenase component 1 [Beduini massiliensis]
MSLYRQFPIASDRMGILWSALPIRDCVVIEYGPAGTTHYGTEIIGDLGIPVQQNFFSTHVDENDIIMGDISRLENAIREVDARYHPRCIFVVGSSLTSVIAADIKGTCRMMSKEVTAKLIPFEHGGFRGDYALGIRDALSAAVKAMVEPTKETVIGTYNIIGACHDIYRIGSDVNEIKQIMKECFHMEATCVLPYDCDYDAIKECAKAELTLIIRDEAKQAGETIALRGNTKLAKGAPYGYEGTKNWILMIADILNKEPNAAYISKLDKKIQWVKLSGRQFMFSGLKNKVIIEGAAYVVKGIGEFFKNELFYEVKGISSHSLKYCKDLPDYIEFYEDEKDKLDLIRSYDNAMLLGSAPVLNEAAENTVKMLISFPILHGSVIAIHMPFMGINGADLIMEQVMAYKNDMTIRFMMQ